MRLCSAPMLRRSPQSHESSSLQWENLPRFQTFPLLSQSVGCEIATAARRRRRMLPAPHPCRATAVGPVPVASMASLHCALRGHHGNSRSGWCIVRHVGLHSLRENTLGHHLHFKAGLLLSSHGSDCPSTSLKSNSLQQGLLVDVPTKIPVLNYAPKILVGAPGACQTEHAAGSYRWKCWSYTHADFKRPLFMHVNSEGH